MSFAVYIIESPSPSDLDQGTMEGAALVEALEQHEIPAEHLIVHTKASLAGAIVDLCWLAESADDEPSYLVIHISAHGDSRGIQLSDRTDVAWSERRAEVHVNEAAEYFGHSPITMMRIYDEIEPADLERAVEKVYGP